MDQWEAHTDRNTLPAAGTAPVVGERDVAAYSRTFYPGITIPVVNDFGDEVTYLLS